MTKAELEIRNRYLFLEYKRLNAENKALKQLISKFQLPANLPVEPDTDTPTLIFDDNGMPTGVSYD